MRKLLSIIFILVLAGAAIYFFFFFQKQEQIAQVTNFEECVTAGNPIMESYPAQCHANGQTFTQDIGNEIEKMDLIQIIQPRPNTIVTSPLIIQGNARGNWFFEGTFEVYILDENGTEIARSFAQAQEDWMTENFVYYESKLIFEKPTTVKGTLVLEKQNASGLPEHDDKLLVPVLFE
ncbi:MAG TPA: Gmad2 immunoglobulin-like domain-containing protein [Candidatus Woesebacteria bacterium]|nr:Gmad2 immunoglobulin-like domain-containing protein [Candidatus Woesebacteria bacterium]